MARKHKMLTQRDFEQKLLAEINDAEIVARYEVGDPLVVQQIKANAAYLALLAREIDVASLEPFIKTRERSIIADATNKGILPIATPCQYTLEIKNNGTSTVSLSAGRIIEDNAGGRPWRLLASATVNAGQTVEVIAEQSETRVVQYTVPIPTESFHKAEITLSPDMFLAGITVKDDLDNVYTRYPRWMNVAKEDYAVNLTTDSFRRLFVEFGDNDRAGRTAIAGEVYAFTLIECYGAIDISRLKDASLVDIFNINEQKISVRFKTGGLVRLGTNPLSTAQLRALATYPSLYDENAVFLGNFDYLARKKFMSRCDYLAIWNETVQERAYLSPSIDNINHLFCCVAPKTGENLVNLQADIGLAIGIADNLYQDRVVFSLVDEKPYPITIKGRLAASHNRLEVEAQLKTLLVEKYGKGTLAASRWLEYGFNRQEIINLIKKNITAFQDNISDFTVILPLDESLPIKNKPHEWVFMDEANITLEFALIADTTGATWTIM